MTDPNDISLDSSGLHSRRDVYALIHFANIIRKNILSIAPGVEQRGFQNFLRGPSTMTHRAISVATSNLPKTITKSVVAAIGKYHVESKDNIGYSPKFERIFMRNYGMQELAANFFIKNLTTARCNGRIVFLIQPMLVFRYDLKCRESWIDRCRFIWISAAFFRLPSLLPVVAAQIFLYTIKIFIQQPSLTRKEELSILAEILHFLPGMASVAKPPFGMGLSVWYREMSRHRRIALEAILNEAARNGQDLRYYNPPYSTMNFTSTKDLKDFIKEELKECDKQETIERAKGKKRPQAKKDRFGEDSDVDDEDIELLHLGGCGGRIVDEEDEDDEEEEENEEKIEVEEVEEEDMEEHSEPFIQFFQSRNENNTMEVEIDADRTEDLEIRPSLAQIFLNFPPYKHLLKKIPYDYGNGIDFTCEDEAPISLDCNDNLVEKKRENISDKSDENNYALYDNEFIEDVRYEDISDTGECCFAEKVEETIIERFDSVPVFDGCETEGDANWNPLNELSEIDIVRGFEEAQKFLLEDSQTMECTMNLIVPMTPVIKKSDDDIISSDSPPSLVRIESDRQLKDDISPPPRSDDDSRENECGESDEDEEETPMIDRQDCFLETIILPSHIRRAPFKKMRMNDDDDDDDESTEGKESTDAVDYKQYYGVEGQFMYGRLRKAIKKEPLEENEEDNTAVLA